MQNPEDLAALLQDATRILERAPSKPAFDAGVLDADVKPLTAMLALLEERDRNPACRGFVRDSGYETAHRMTGPLVPVHIVELNHRRLLEVLAQVRDSRRYAKTGDRDFALTRLQNWQRILDSQLERAKRKTA